MTFSVAYALKMHRSMLLIIFTLFKLCISIPPEKYAENVGLFWHVTDLHVDQNYSRSGNPYNLCHQANVLYPDNGLYGNFFCDSPEYLVNVTFEAMKKIEPNPDFIIWTGDNLPHTKIYDADWDVIYEALHNVSVLLSENFPKIPVFPCIGNHDTFPPNMLLPNETSISIYEDILKKGGWNQFLNEEAISTFIKGGFYSQVIEPGLRIVSLNTILWYYPNDFTKDMIDPANQFKWLEGVLNNSSRSSEKVYIIGHVPPGFYNRVPHGEKSTPTFHLQYLDAYLNILKKYSGVIAGQMFGHLHIDMFQIFLLGSGHFMSSSVLAGSVTPWHSPSKNSITLPVNPAVRLMHYDHVNGLLKDYDQFYLNLTEANSINSNKDPVDLYELLYTFTKAYDVPDVSTRSLVEVFEKIKSHEVLFDIFFRFSTAGKESVTCDSFCKVAQLCSISSISMEEYDTCMKNSSNSVVCQDNYNSSDQEQSYFLPYGIVGVALCVSIVLLFFACQKYRRSRSDIYTKLLRDY